MKYNYLLYDVLLFFKVGGPDKKWSASGLRAGFAFLCLLRIKSKYSSKCKWASVALCTSVFPSVNCQTTWLHWLLFALLFLCTLTHLSLLIKTISRTSQFDKACLPQRPLMRPSGPVVRRALLYFTLWWRLRRLYKFVALPNNAAAKAAFMLVWLSPSLLNPKNLKQKTEWKSVFSSSASCFCLCSSILARQSSISFYFLLNSVTL